ncbi:efflux RND transporter periplasmic adaptor subunit [Paenibacillus doosanensis]|uniref:Cation efflux system protein CusB n=1 Tax=Paenibacillus konkukensis TaxID=2020716 RepID=A0ABY4RTA9_9BACL|nr:MULTISPECIES: efflux RND transporter periplasmic adaptor subunit [Paenibacillus]MCS7461006.1 efflux RND transporter periplasmic adaptor subunit [Paenibacillus doosanensis]UQZ85677.1 Cation efflux system protein CusB precursor [Paenibacillus konkukensis]
MRRKRHRLVRRRVKTVAVLALSFAIIAGCSETIPLEHNAAGAGSGQEQSQSQQPLKNVKVMKVAKQKIGDPLVHAGDVQSSVQYDIAAKASGDVEAILKARGDMVQEGEVIIRLNSTDAQFQKEKAALAVQTVQDAIAKAKERAKKDMDNQKRELANSIQKSEQNLVDLTKTYNKTKNDYEVGLATKLQVYQMEVQLRNARMDLEQLKQKSDMLEPIDATSELETQLKGAQMTQLQVEQSMSYLEVKAPASGILTEMPLETGMSLQQGAKIGVIQKLDPIKIKAQLKEEEYKYVTGKSELTYYLQGAAQKNKGKISFLAKVIDPDTKAYEINVDVPNQNMELKPGMKVWLQLTEDQDQIVVAVPTYSIVKEGDDNYVFVLNGDTVEKRKVQLGRLNDSIQEITSGVNEGEQVVVEGMNQLNDKEKVKSAAVEQQK